MQGWIRRCLCALAVVIAATSLAACGGGDEETAAEAPAPAEPAAAESAGAESTLDGTTPATPIPVRIATDPWIGYGPWWIAAEKGFDKENGIDLEIIGLTTVGDFAAAVGSGQVDAANIPTNSVLVYEAANIPVKVVLFEDVSETGDGILATKEIESISDLQGKKVAVEEGGTPELVLLYALQEAGLTMDDIEVVRIPSPDAGAALVAGRVDAAATYQPFLSSAQNEGDFNLIYTAGERPGLISDVLVVTDSFAAENPDAVTGLLKTWHQAMEFFRSNPDEAIAIVAKNVELDPALVAQEYEGIPLYDLEESHDFLVNEFVALANDIEKILKDTGALTGNPDIEGSLDVSYGERALAEE